MAKDVTLTDKNNETIYPRTFIKNVYDNDGATSLDKVLLNFVKDVDLNDLDVRLTDAMNSEDLRLNNALNSVSMCPAGGKYIQVSIKSYTTADAVVFTAPDNGYATIRGNFSGSWAYCIKDGGGSFYQWASASGSPFFPLRKGATIVINYVTGTMTWADLYFVSAKQI